MNREELLEHLARDNWWRKNFLVFHSQHLHLKWDEAIDAYLANDRSQREERKNHNDIDKHLTGFIESSQYPAVQGLEGYVQTFAGQALQNQQKLTDEFKGLIYDLTLLHLADHYNQPVDGIQEKVYQSLEKLPQGRAFEVVAKFSQNIANKIAEDLESYIREAEEMSNTRYSTTPEQEKRYNQLIDYIASENYYLWHENAWIEAGFPEQAFSELNSRIASIELTESQTLNNNIWIEESSNEDAVAYLSLNGSTIDDDSINAYLDNLELSSFQERLDKLEELSTVLETTWNDVQEKANLIFESIEAEYGSSEVDRELEPFEPVEPIVSDFNERFGNLDWQDKESEIHQIQSLPERVMNQESFKNAFHNSDIEKTQRDEIDHEEKGIDYLYERYPKDSQVLYNERSFKIQSIRQNPEGTIQVNLAPWSISGLVDIEPILIYPSVAAVEAGLKKVESTPEVQEENKVDSWTGIAMLREEYPYKTPVTYEGEDHLVIGSGYQSQEEQYFIRLQPVNGGQVIGQNPMIAGKSPQAVLDQMRNLKEQVRETQNVADRAYARQDLRDGFVRDRVADEQGDVAKERGREETEEAREEYREEALAEQASSPVSAHDFTLVLDAAYNVGEPRQLGTTPADDMIPVWNMYYDLVDRLGSLDAVVSEADAQGYLDKDSDFYREYYEDRVRENHPAFVFPEDLTNFYPKTPTEKVSANIEAISLVKLLEHQSRQATPEEQEVLAKYVGWGGLANEFFNENNPKFSEQRQELKNLVSEKEYAAMRESSLTAYYTDPAIVKEMYQKLLDDGFTGGRILDPSMGTGTFFAAMPEEIRQNSELYGVELDTITGAIAKQLHPDANISIKGFEDMNFNEESFDLVMSNIPFADIKITDKAYEKPYMIHDYFIRKSMDLVRDGGVVSVISSTGTMDKRVGNIMKELADEDINFLGGVRLPDTAFKAIAGTDVTTDILYLQKDESKLENQSQKPFSLAFEAAVPLEKNHNIWLNPYFGQVPDYLNPYVLGEFEVKNYNGGTLSVRYNGDNLISDLQEALQHTAPMVIKDVTPVPDVMREADKPSITDVPVEYLEQIPSYSYELFEDKVLFKDGKSISDVRVGAKMEQISYYVDSEGSFKEWDSKFSEKFIENFKELQVTDDTALDVYVSDLPANRGKYAGLYKKTVFFEQPFTEREIERIKGMIQIRNTYMAMIHLQRDPAYSREEFGELLRDLNQGYDKFVSEFGYLNTPINRNLFDEDDRYSLIASLENYSELDNTYSKSVVFEKAMIRPAKPEVMVDNAMDALQISLSEGRGVDFDFMSRIYQGKDKDTIRTELGDAIIPDPLSALDGKLQYESRHHFLSGDVVDKLEAVEQLISQEDTSQDWTSYRTMLEEAQPDRIHLTDIDFKVGSRWIPTEVYEMFAANTFTREQYSLEQIQGLNYSAITTNPLTGEYNVGKLFRYGGLSPNYHNLGVRGTRYDTGIVVFNNLLNNDQKTIMTKDVDGRSVLNAEATAALRGREEDIQDLFREFVRSNLDVQNLLENTYNGIFNRTVSRTYDGSALEIDGLASNIELREHQKNAIQRIVEEKRALLAHEVGSGKTLTMLGAGFKMKELGMVNKPMYVVPSSLTAQFGQEIAKFFPTKNVYVTTPKDFVKARRKQFISRINTGDYDAVVIGASQFEKIPVNPERREQHILDKLDELHEVKNQMEGNTVTQKQLIRMEKSLEAQLKELQNLQQDSFIEFENLGVDMLFVDEAHGFKNIRPTTNLNNVAGITTATAKKNMDMEMKVRHIQEEHGGRNVVFATGTPVSNSISEIYTMMNYIQPDVLEKHQIDKFDAWVGAFGNIENSMELNPTGDKYVVKQRFKEFTNLPELMKIYKETADIQTSDMLDLPVPNHEIKKVVSELTPSQKEYLDYLVERTEKIQSGGVDPSLDNMLKVTSEARKLAIDMRLLDPQGYSIEDNQKIMQVVDNVERIYREGETSKATQMIFSDIGTPKSGNNPSSFDVYSEIKRLLIERGIPKEQIAFVHDANTDVKKNALSRKVNSGDVRILMASTEKGGTGLNVQAKMKAVHHIDVPWRPSDIIQRNGRLIRQGNEHQNVEIYHYITKGSFDNYLWQTQENKLRYITQMMTSKDPVRAMSDVDDQIMTASDFKAEATGNPYLKAKMTLENELTTLSAQRRAFERDQDAARQNIVSAERDIPSLNRRLENYESDLRLAENHPKDEFSMVVAGQVYDTKSEAGNTLHDLLRDNISDVPEVRTLGTYRGFDIRAKTMTPFEAMALNTDERLGSMMFSIIVKGENTYPVTLDLASGLGTVQRINNVIDSIESDQERILNKRDNLIEKSAAARDILGNTFPKEEEYQLVKEKLAFLKPLVESGKSGDEISKAIEEKSAQMKQENQKDITKNQIEL